MERITEDFLQRILSDESPSCKIAQYKVSDAVARGENFMSLTFRVDVELASCDNEETKKHLIVKLQPNNAVMRERFMTGRAFCKEVLVYKHILPAFVTFAKGKRVENPLSFFPKCIGGMADGSVNDFLVLEDLKPLGFKMAEKGKGLGLSECELVMKALGKFHAFSLAMKQEDPESFEDLCRDMDEFLYIPEKEEDFSASITNSVDLAIRAFQSKYPGTTVPDRIAKLKNGYYLKLCDLVKPKSRLSVISHGDCWGNNLLFKYDNNGEVSEVKLLDLQISRYASPAIDLQYFLNMSTTKNIRSKHLDQLLHVYHESIKRFLKVLGSNQHISFSTIEQEFNDYKIYGLFSAVWILPHVLVDTKAVPGVEELTEEDVAKVGKANRWNSAITSDYEERIVDILIDNISSGVI